MSRDQHWMEKWSTFHCLAHSLVSLGGASGGGESLEITATAEGFDEVFVFLLVNKKLFFLHI